MPLIYIIFGFLFLFTGGEFLVRGAIKIAKDLNLSKVIIGVTIVAYGTSAPEVFITLQAALKGLNDIAIGNIIGSNIANIFLVLGITALISPIKIPSILFKFDLKYLLISAIALLLFIFTYQIARLKAIILLFILIVYTISTFKRHKSTTDEDIIERSLKEIEEQFFSLTITSKVATFLIILGSILLVFGGHFLVTGASDLARYFDIPESVIAVTIVAIGGSAPELVTSVVAAYRKHSDIAIGNIVGSNIFNILGVLGISSLIKPMYSISSFADFDIWVMILASILLFFFARKLIITKFQGMIFLFLYILYLTWQINIIFQ